ncbi:hypothetical protein RND71_002059 [Anisodus tanguticus]|uniref:Uncharacterized protein n=1 Tax=Anisodus tanguticus TaxID=243964 RepID=A0AAE1VSR3_9SOLA|nr:hypothetical protein RND71_002059 [Anisodus tanguticus]
MDLDFSCEIQPIRRRSQDPLTLLPKKTEQGLRFVVAREFIAFLDGTKATSETRASTMRLGRSQELLMPLPKKTEQGLRFVVAHKFIPFLDGTKSTSETRASTMRLGKKFNHFHKIPSSTQINLVLPENHEQVKSYSLNHVRMRCNAMQCNGHNVIVCTRSYSMFHVTHEGLMRSIYSPKNPNLSNHIGHPANIGYIIITPSIPYTGELCSNKCSLDDLKKPCLYMKIKKFNHFHKIPSSTQINLVLPENHEQVKSYSLNHKLTETRFILKSKPITWGIWAAFFKALIAITWMMGWAYARGDHVTKEHIHVYWLAPIQATLLAVWTFNLLVSPPKVRMKGSSMVVGQLSPTNTKVVGTSQDIPPKEQYVNLLKPVSDTKETNNGDRKNKGVKADANKEVEVAGHSQNNQSNNNAKKQEDIKKQGNGKNKNA